MKKITYLLFLCLIFFSCSSSPSPTGDPYKDAEAINKLIRENKGMEALELMDECEKFYKEKYGEIEGTIKMGIIAEKVPEE